jgi:rubredoxin
MNDYMNIEIKCPRCGKKLFNTGIDLPEDWACKECLDNEGNELDEVFLKDILNRKGWHWVLKALTR